MILSNAPFDQPVIRMDFMDKDNLIFISHLFQISFACLAVRILRPHVLVYYFILILDEFNTEDDSDLFWELWNGKTNYYLTHRVTDAIEVAIEEKMED